MIGILGGMGTQAGLDFCNKLAMLNRGKIDQEYPLFILYNRSNIPGRPESIGIHAKKLSTIPKKPKNIIKYNKVLKSLLDGCRSLEKSGCKFIVIPCNTAHYWYEDLKNKINIPIINMPKEVFKHTKKNLLGLILSCVSPENFLENLDELKNLGVPFGFKLNGFVTTNPKDGYTSNYNSSKTGNPNEFLGQRKELTPEKMGTFVKKFKDGGATILGGCCETRPTHIKQMTKFI